VAGSKHYSNFYFDTFPALVHVVFQLNFSYASAGGRFSLPDAVSCRLHTCRLIVVPFSSANAADCMFPISEVASQVGATVPVSRTQGYFLPWLRLRLPILSSRRFTLS
jgi:hypothetical protein